MKSKKSKKLILIIGLTFMFIALGFMLFPTVSNAVNVFYSKNTIVSYDDNVSTLSAIDKLSYFSAAEDYNEKLRDTVGSFSYSTNSYIDGYDDILNFEGIIGYIKIPEISVDLPIYHGSDDKVLTKGAAHIPNTAFPTGGKGNHTVISAHTGYPGKVFFDDLPDLEQGDLIYISVLDETLVYKVKDINIVKPDNTELLGIDEDKDLLSLITCYPYGVNSHRLIVTAERTYPESTADEAESLQSNPYTLWIILTAAALVLIIIIVIALLIKRKRRTV